MKAGMRARLFAPWSKPASAELLMPDEPEHKRVHTVLDDAQIAADVRVDPMFAKDPRPIRWKIDTDPKCKGPGGKPIRIRGMIEDGKLYKPGEAPDEN